MDRASNAAAIDDARVRRSILMLDEATATDANSSPLFQRANVVRVFQALAFFLEISILLEQPTSAAARRHLVLVVEARVLSCLSRFISGRPRLSAASGSVSADSTAPTWQRWRCQGDEDASSGCVAGAIRTVISCFLFQLSRNPSTAIMVVRSGLYTFLFSECRAAASTCPDAVPFLSTAQQYQDLIYEAEDATVGVDPMDWSTHAMCASLRRQCPVGSVFLLPIGARSLVFLLRGQRLPTNEIEEFGLALERLGAAAESKQQPLGSSLPTKNHRKKPHKLPSLFTFPTRSDPPSDVDDYCLVCMPRHNATAWAAVSEATTRLHIVVRAVVSLAHFLPKASPERKLFVRDGGVQIMRQLTRAFPSCTSDECEQVGAIDLGVSSVDVLNADIQFVGAMTQAGLKIFSCDEVKASMQDGLMSSSSHSTKYRDESQPLRSPLRERLQVENQRQMGKQSQVEQARQREADRAARRQQVQREYERAMATRLDLMRSLEVISGGRVHPAAENQSIVEWLDSFVTIKKKEQMRIEQQEMRQRRLLEQQYSIEDRRRRERDERILMSKNDHDILDSNTNRKEEARREAFARLQNEMQEQADAGEMVLIKKREAAREEAKRLQAILEIKRRQEHENDLMKRDDTFYVEKIMRDKQARSDQERKARLVDPMAEQREKIERMRKRDDELKRTEKEQQLMRAEELLARQRRFIEAETLKREIDRERKARKLMEAEEIFVRLQWKRIEEALAKQAQDDVKQRRAEQRRAKRQQEQQWKEWQARWVANYDSYGSTYYYNQVTGQTQWENPFEA